MQEHAPHKHVMSFGDWKMPDHSGIWTIECSSCECGMIGMTRDAVIAAWNRRAPSAELAAMERDAERYRHLRDDGYGFDVCVLEMDEHGESWVHGYPPEELDAAIDAAMAAMKGGE